PPAAPAVQEDVIDLCRAGLAEDKIVRLADKSNLAAVVANAQDLGAVGLADRVVEARRGTGGKERRVAAGPVGRGAVDAGEESQVREWGFVEEDVPRRAALPRDQVGRLTDKGDVAAIEADGGGGSRETESARVRIAAGRGRAACAAQEGHCLRGHTVAENIV